MKQGRYSTFYLVLKAETINYNSDIDIFLTKFLKRCSKIKSFYQSFNFDPNAKNLYY